MKEETEISSEICKSIKREIEFSPKMKDETVEGEKRVRITRDTIHIVNGIYIYERVYRYLTP